MPEILRTLVPYLVVGMLFLAVLLFLAALWNFRRGKREPYWRLRRAASLQGWELFLVALTMAFVAAAVCLFSGFAQAVLGGYGPGQTPAAVLTAPTAAVPTVTAPPPSLTPIVITATPEPTLVTVTPRRTPTRAVSTAPPTATMPPTATLLTASPSPSLSPTASPFGVTPLASSVTPLPTMSVQITAVDSAVTDDLMPVNPRATLEAGIRRLYFWVSYAGMIDGVPWERLLVYEGVPLQGGAYLWSGGETGTALYFFGDSEGFAPGRYEIRLSLGGETVASSMVILE